MNAKAKRTPTETWSVIPDVADRIDIFVAAIRPQGIGKSWPAKVQKGLMETIKGWTER